MTAQKKSREIWLEVLRVYKEMTYLYDRKHENYHDRKYREKGYLKLWEIYKTSESKATFKIFKRRLDNMKNGYFREVKKRVRASRTRNPYSYLTPPLLWYFEAFSFLNNTSRYRRTVHQAMKNDKDSSLSSDEDDDINRNGPMDKAEIKIEPSEERENNIPNWTDQSDSRKCDEWEILGRAMGLQLRELNKRQLIISRKLISEIIYYAALERLCEKSHIVLGDISETSRLKLYSSGEPHTYIFNNYNNT